MSFNPDDSVRFSYDKRSLLRFLGRRFAASLGHARPMVAYVKLTRRCNLDCGYCPWHTIATNFAGELSTEEWIKVIDRLYESGVRIFVLEGGEPTLRRDLQALIDYIHGCRNAYTILATNGVGHIWNFRPRAFTISVDGPELIHDAVRGPGTFRRILKNLRCRSRDQWVASITVISRHNYEHIEQMVEELAPLVDTFMFTMLYPYKNAAALALSPDEVKRVKQRLISLTREYPVFNTRKQLSKNAGEWTCYDYLTASVDYTGKIRNGCFVDHVEPRDCSKCELACYGMLSAFHRLDFGAWFNLHRLLLRRL